MSSESVLSTYRCDMVLPAEKNVVSYSMDSITSGVVAITQLRVIFKTGKGQMAIPFTSVLSIGKDPGKWGKGREDTNISVEAQIGSDRYKIMLYTKEEERDEAIGKIRCAVIGTSPIYFKSPATRGGVMDTSQPWRKGILTMGDSSAQLISERVRVNIPFKSIVDHGRNLRTLDTKGKPSITIIHVENDEEVSTVIIGHDQRLSMIEDHLHDLTQKLNSDLDLDENLNQLLTVLYTGEVDECTLMEMMGTTAADLDQMYDRLVSLNLAKIVRVKKELALTNQGIRYIDLMIKKGLG